MTSWIKQPTQMNLQTERGIPACRSLQDCLPLMQEGNFWEYYPFSLQPQVSYNSTERCVKERTWSHITTEFYSGNVCISRALPGSQEELSELWSKQCLATIWGMKKFHYFLYSKQFTLETNQKPLVAIYKKHMVEIFPRIQCLVVRSFPYQPFNVRYWKGVEIPLADVLSRVTPLPMEEDGIHLPIIAVNQVTWQTFHTVPMIWTRSMRKPRKTLHSSFWCITFQMDGLCEQRQLPWEFHIYWNYWKDLSIKDRIATKDSRVLIPSTLSKESLAANTQRTPRSG